MMTKTEPHDSNTCTAGVDGQQCKMCQFAEESARRRALSPSLTYYGHPRLDTGPAGFLESEAKSDSEPILTQSSPILAPTFTHEWEAAPAHLKPVFHPNLIRAAVFDVIDGGCDCATSANAHHPWKFDDEIEDFANEQRVRFIDAVIARLSELRRLSGERDPSSEYFFLRGERAGQIAQMLEENRVFKEMAERRRLTK